MSDKIKFNIDQIVSEFEAPGYQQVEMRYIHEVMQPQQMQSQHGTPPPAQMQISSSHTVFSTMAPIISEAPLPRQPPQLRGGYTSQFMMEPTSAEYNAHHVPANPVLRHSAQ